MNTKQDGEATKTKRYHLTCELDARFDGAFGDQVDSRVISSGATIALSDYTRGQLVVLEVIGTDAVHEFVASDINLRHDVFDIRVVQQ